MFLIRVHGGSPGGAPGAAIERGRPAVVHSASDLKAAVECEWALMRRLDAKLGRVTAVPDPPDAMNARAGALGDVHEQRQLDAYLAQYGVHAPGTRGGVAVIARPSPPTDPAALRAAEAATTAAIRDGADVVFQGTFFDGAFLGFADFLVRSDDGSWEVYDTKLARRAKITALLQLAAYTEQLQRLGVAIGPNVHLMLGDGTTSTHRIADIAPVFDLRIARLRVLIDARLDDMVALQWGAAGITACGRCAECTAQVQANRDVLLVGRLNVGQRARLAAAGITTIDELAASSGAVEGITAAPLAKLRSQAQLQLEAPADVDGQAHRVLHRVVDSSGLAAIPEPDPGDIFFDFEGDPLWSDDGRVWGLEYLFGSIVHEGDDPEHFLPFWAHDRAGERHALLDFLHFVEQRRLAHPGLHIYHYADYERSHLQQLCARHGVGEAMLDTLLREHVFVDLYPVVIRSIRISDRSYSLKKLEPLYMGAELRQSAVTNAADSVDAYVQYTELVREGAVQSAADLLAEIGDYNRYDCVSTLRLRDWLLGEAAAHGVRPRPSLDPDEPSTSDDLAIVRREDVARDALLASIDGVATADRTPTQHAIALAAAAIEYHRREDKSFWWEHFNRQISPIDDWAEQRGVFVIDAAEVIVDWCRVGRRKSDSRELSLVGRPAPGSTFAVDDTVYVMYDEPAPAGCDAVPAGQRSEHARGTITQVVVTAGGATQILITETAGGENEGWLELPVALTPPAPLRTTAQRQAILEWGESLAAALPGIGHDAAADILMRVAPRLTAGGPADAGDGDVPAAIAATVLRLDHSYLAVQGPPGSGKTYVGAHVIAELVRDHHWKIGVVAQSHAVIENLLERVRAAGVDRALVAKRRPAAKGGVRPPPGDWTQLDDNIDVLPFIRRNAASGFVLGGTAWDFSNPTKVPRGELDLLVIDEAGQYSLANTIGVAVSARNLLLLGDPQQLPQVSQGLHPEPVDESALGWLSDGHNVLPPAFGYFLTESWRMHPALTAAVSDLSYDGLLRSRLPETTYRAFAGLAPGLHSVPLEHAGDATESLAEGRRVVELVSRHVGRRWTDPGRHRFDDPLSPADIIVVAPYNAQVALIRTLLDAAGFAATPVGTVDKFQGREAVLAIVSLTASSAADVPRGISFVLQRNRLNVAISRAKWAAFLIHSPALAEYLPTTAEGLTELAAFLRLTSTTA